VTVTRQTSYPSFLSAPITGLLYDRLMSLEWEQTIIDARDPRALGLWWRDALG